MLITHNAFKFTKESYNEEFLGVTLACGDVQMKAHKVCINNFFSFHFLHLQLLNRSIVLREMLLEKKKLKKLVIKKKIWMKKLKLI